MYQTPDKTTNRLLVYGEYLAAAQALPQNTSAYGDEGAAQFAGTMQGLRVLIGCNEAITITATKKLQFELWDSATETGTFTKCGGTVELTDASTDLEYAAEDLICEIPVPEDMLPWAKLKIITDDASAAGKIDAWLDYVPR